MAGIRGYKRDGTLAGLCLVIGGGSCKWQLTALVKAVAGGCCSVVHGITYKHQKFLFLFVYSVCCQRVALCVSYYKSRFLAR